MVRELRRGGVLAIAAMLALQVWASDGPTWSYSGKSGPEQWGKLSRDYLMCKLGKNQSPIDIDRMAVLRTDLRPIEFQYETPLPLTVIHNGHTLLIPVPEKGNKWRIRAERETFTLVNVHFHAPSEHTDGGNRYPLEAHFVHRDERGALAVVGVWFREGDENPVLAQILQAAPEPLPVAKGKEAKGHREAKRTTNETVDLRALLPKSEGFFRYSGSLTTPPCSEGVRWYVMQEPVPASSQQLHRMREQLKENVRPVQPLNARRVLE